MRSILKAAVAATLLALLAACAGTTGKKALEAADDGVNVAEHAAAMTPRSGDSTAEKSQVDPSTAVAASMGATAIAAPTKAVKDAQNSSTGHVQTGFMLGGATDSQMAFVNGLIEKDKSLQSIGAQIDALLVAWSAEGGQTPANAKMLTDLRESYEARFDALSKVGAKAMPTDLSKLTTLGVFNWASGYGVGAELQPMSAAEATAARAAAIAQWQAIHGIATNDDEAVVDGGTADPIPDDPAPAE